MIEVHRPGSARAFGARSHWGNAESFLGGVAPLASQASNPPLLQAASSKTCQYLSEVPAESFLSSLLSFFHFIHLINRLGLELAAGIPGEILLAAIFINIVTKLHLRPVAHHGLVVKD